MWRSNTTAKFQEIIFVGWARTQEVALARALKKGFLHLEAVKEVGDLLCNYLDVGRAGH